MKTKTKKVEKLPKAFKTKWLKALRSGTFIQGVHALETLEGKFCCLGVACRIQHPRIKLKDKGLLTESSRNFKRLRDINVPNLLKGNTDDNPIVAKLTRMNDGGKSFKVIANWIEKNL